ncbi:manganese efflux pump MntP [Mesotoga sp. Brook.08.YT.4.2.5.1]|uniref:manganese efflux pump MntP n=2 Tax=Mesotoga TaxID=1184396 RepID=UPI0021550478|nr:manganese efflux pump MntP family protein [Mesotoga sp. Brook.08.YT.4.2.5.1]
MCYYLGISHQELQMENLLVATGLALDAFAVSICTGISLEDVTRRHVFRVAFHFGLFQFGMPIIGYFLAASFRDYIMDFDHWIAFILLGIIGGKMLLESLDRKEEVSCKDRTRGLTLILLSIATSIDALAVGSAYAFLGRPIILTAMMTGLITATLSALGVTGGQRLGQKFGKFMEATGGIVLISIGLKILFKHLY